MQRVLQDVGETRRRHIEAFLEAVIRLRCGIESPPAVRQDYVNIQPPRAYGAGRVCSLTRSIGRIEFQTDSYALAESLGVAAHFSFLAAGAKGAISPNTDDEVEAAIALAKAVPRVKATPSVMPPGVERIAQRRWRCRASPRCRPGQTPTQCATGGHRQSSCSGSTKQVATRTERASQSGREESVTR